MTAPVIQQARWNTLAYQRIATTQFADGNLLVEFEDGSRVALDPRPLLPPQLRHPDWSRVVAQEYEIVVPTEDGPFEIPWDVIRVRTDPAYDSHWAEASRAAAERTGNRIRLLREARLLTIEDLSVRTGIAPAVLGRLERGLADSHEANAQVVLEAMGYVFADLVSDQYDSPEDHSEA
jgi:hypothetical protein